MTPGTPWRLARSEPLLDACVHCGFCLPACPTYEVLGDENDSPRGRLHLMRALLEGRLEAGGAFETHIGQCLGCRACEAVCPAGVEYGTLLESARADGAELRGGVTAALGRLAARLGLWLLTGVAARPLFALLRLAREAGLARLCARLPGRPGLAARLLEATRPAPELRRGAGGGASGRRGASAGPGTGARASPAATPRPAPERPTYALLEGCVMDGLFAHVHRATRQALAAAGYREVRARGQACCGALHAHAGLQDEALRLALRNLRAFEEAGADRIAVNSAGCGAALREYPRWLSDDPARAARARRLAERVRDVSELLISAPRAIRGRPSAAGRVAYDAPCHLLYGQGVREEPLELLADLGGTGVEPLPSSTRCCGGAGTYNLRHRELAERVLAPKLEEVAAGGYTWVATGNPGCIMQIGAGLREAGARARAVHPVELVAAGLERNNGPAPVSHHLPRDP